MNVPESATSTAHRRLVLVVMCVGYFLVLLDVTIVNVALPRLGAGLGVGTPVLQWVVDGYALALATLLLAAGTIGDVHGHRRVVLTGLGVFGLASVGCALAPYGGALVGARVVQGIGAALLLPGTLAMIVRTVPGPREQARAIGVWAGVGSLALPAGPLLGGLLVDTVGWRWVFAVNVPVVLVAVLVVARGVPDDRGHGGRWDRAGTALAGTALAALTVAVIQVGHAGPDGVAALGVLVAVLAAVGFVRVQRRTATPLLPPGLLRRPAFTVANLVAGAMNLGTLGLLFLLTLFLQGVQHRSALVAGVILLPLSLPLTVLAPLTGRVVGRFGPGPVMVAGLLVAACGVGFLATWSADSGYPALLPPLLGWGVGLGLLTPSVVAAATAAVPPERSGLAAGVTNTARQAGGVLGIAAYGAVAGPVDGVRFLPALHLAGLATAALFLAAALATATLLPQRP